MKGSGIGMVEVEKPEGKIHFYDIFQKMYATKDSLKGADVTACLCVKRRQDKIISHQLH